jgi:hypothetical protein
MSRTYGGSGGLSRQMAAVNRPSGSSSPPFDAQNLSCVQKCSIRCQSCRRFHRVGKCPNMMRRGVSFIRHRAHVEMTTTNLIRKRSALGSIRWSQKLSVKDADGRIGLEVRVRHWRRGRLNANRKIMVYNVVLKEESVSEGRAWI